MKIDYVNGKNSNYKCDMCHKLIKLEEVNKINCIKNRNTKKLFDLCEKCFSKVNNSVKTYYERNKK